MASPMRDIGGRNRPPCKDCPDRHTACSDHCVKEKFLAWKAEKEKIDKAMKTVHEMDRYMADQIRKNRRIK